MMNPHSSATNCVYVTGFCRHGTPAFRIAFAMMTSLRAMATMTNLCGLEQDMSA